MTTKIPIELSSTPSIVDNGDATAITIDSSENVMIGTTDAQIYDHTSGEGIVFRNGEAIDIARSGDSQMTLNRMSDEGANISLHQAGTLRATIGTKGSGGFYIGTNGDNERMRLGSNGNLTLSDSLGVGTGTTDPNSRLQIKKDGTGNYANQTFSNANSTAGITFGIAGSGTGNYLANNAFLLNTGASAFIFGTSDVEKMRIDSAGKVGIGTTSPSGTLDVHTSSVGVAIEHDGSNAFNHLGEFFCPNLTNTENALVAIGKSGNTKQSGYIGYYWTADNSNNNFIHLSHWASDYLLRVYGNGNYSFAGSNVSDRDLKENIVDISEPSLDKVKQLRVRKFNMIPLGKNDVTPTKVGFIAQEVQEAMPDVVSGTDGKKDMAVDTTGITGHLVKAIQELSAKIEELEGKIE